MERFGVSVGMLCAVVSGAALAQSAGRPGTGNASTGVGESRNVLVDHAAITAEMGRNGGSLAKASLSVAPVSARPEVSKADPTKARLMAVSYLAVPDVEPKVVQKHDLVTIIVREESAFSSDGNSELKKTADLDARLEEWIKLDPRNIAVKGGAQGSTPPSIKASGSRNFKGEATVDRTDSFVTRIAARVIDVKPNGTFVIQARKFIKHDDEESEYTLTGNCRAADLTPDNTILSTQVDNLEIINNHRGAVKDTTKRGLIPKLLDFINPF